MEKCFDEKGLIENETIFLLKNEKRRKLTQKWNNIWKIGPAVRQETGGSAEATVL